MTLPVLANTQPARANHGRWVCECARPYCRNAWQVVPGETQWQCNLCGATTLVQWPPDPAAVEYLLLLRPDPATRNWEPDEPLEKLLVENVQNGLIPPELAELEDRTPDVMTVVDGRVVSGVLLPSVKERREQLAVSAGEATFKLGRA